MRNRLGLVLVLTFAVGCSKNSSSGPSSTGCEVNTDCEAGELCTDGACIKICNSDTACGDGRICVEQLCIPGTRQQPPHVDSIDGDGSADGAADHADHHIVRRLTIHGENLAGVEVTMSQGDTDYGALEVCSSTDATAEIELPDGLLADATNPTQYTLTVANQAGECQVTVPILQGEPGEPQTSIDGLTGGDIAGDVTVSGDLRVSGRLDLYRRDEGLVLFGRTPNGVTASSRNVLNSTFYGWIEFPSIFPVTVDDPEKLEDSDDPIVVATIDESLNDNGAEWVRIRRESRRAVGLHADAPADAINWMAIEPGVHFMPEKDSDTGSKKRVEAGKHSLADGNTIQFDVDANRDHPFPSPPVILLLPDESVDDNGIHNVRAVNSRIETSFQFSTEGTGDTEAGGIHWIAMEPGEYRYGRYTWYAGTIPAPPAHD